MIPVDLHSHSHFSLCGIHSHLEMLQRAQERGMAALAITDHGPELKGRINTPFFERLNDPLPGIRLLKGIECNVRADGTIDLPQHITQWCDVVLAGIHEYGGCGIVKGRCTEMMLAAIERFPCIDIIAHPDDTNFPLDLPQIAAAARARGIALELNNSKVALGRYQGDGARAMLHICKSIGCRIAVNSDAHAINEVGCDDAATRLLRETEFPAALIVNDTAAKAFAWLEERRAGKLAA